MRKTDEEYCPQSLLWDINEWWFNLPSNVRARTPLPDIYVPDGKSGYETGVIWVRTRRRVTAEGIESLNEIEADRIVKRRFLEAIGEGFDENRMVFFAKPLRTRSDQN